jgi:hypothetical protein
VSVLRRSGRQAAAATGVVAEVTAAVLPTIMFDVDQPFVFVLRDTETGAILFVAWSLTHNGVGRRRPAENRLGSVERGSGADCNH